MSTSNCRPVTGWCTLCTGINDIDNPRADEWPGFYRGCICRDEGKPVNGWVCDGFGRLTKSEVSK